jgi:hypothetical protein
MDFKRKMSHIENRNFPGQQNGASIQEVRDMVKKQWRIKGYNFTVPTGNTPYPIQLTGDARKFLGLMLHPNKTTFTATLTEIISCTFKINNEIIIEDLNPNILNGWNNADNFIAIPRPLSGTDQITIEFKNPGATESVAIALYYI